MKRYIYASAAACICGLFVSLAASQTATPPAGQGEQPAPTFVGGVSEVIVPVTVTDDKGKFVSNLTRADFRLLDEGRPQRIELFSHSLTQPAPVVVGFLVDLSSASVIHWKNYKDAIQELIWGLLPGDKRYTGYLITYGQEAELVMNTSSDGDTMGQKVERLKPGGGGAALYDAIYMACKTRNAVEGEPYEPRRVIVIIGDGHDSTSHHSFGEVLEIAKRYQVTIYGVSTVSYGFTAAEQSNLERLAGETGGRVEYPLNTLYKEVSGYLSTPRDAGNYVYEPGSGGYASERLRGIVKAVQSIQGDLTTQYVLRYKPDIDPETRAKVYRRIKVEIPDLPNAKVYYREGYYPFPAGATPPAGGAPQQ